MTDDGCFHRPVTGRTGSGKSSLTKAPCSVGETVVIAPTQMPAEHELAEDRMPAMTR